MSTIPSAQKDRNLPPNCLCIQAISLPSNKNNGPYNDTGINSDRTLPREWRGIKNQECSADKGGRKESAKEKWDEPGARVSEVEQETYKSALQLVSKHQANIEKWCTAYKEVS
jgi:hypothetical protein